MKSLIKDEVLSIRSDGKYVRDYLYVKDVVRGYLMLANNIREVKGEVFNFGSDDTFSVLELIRIVEKSLKKKLKYKILDKAKNEIPYQSLDYTKIRKKIGWEAKSTVITTSSRIYRWYTKIV